MANRQKIIRDQRCSADQPAVYVRHREHFRGIRRLDATAIKNHETVRHSSIERSDSPSQKRMHLLRLIGRGRSTGPDCPNRLLGKNRLAQCSHTGVLDNRIDLPGNNRFGFS